MDKRKSFENLLKMSLRHLYSAESQIYTYLPVMIDHARTYKLRNAFITHYDQTEQHLKRLEKVFKTLQIGIEEEVELKNDALKSLTSLLFKEKNIGMEGLILESIDFRQHSTQGGASDFSLAAIGQLIEQYEIGMYDQAILLAKHLNYSAVEKLLKESQAEDTETCNILSKIEREELKNTSNHHPLSAHLYIKKPNLL